jgi:hypothetical protein
MAGVLTPSQWVWLEQILNPSLWDTAASSTHHQIHFRDGNGACTRARCMRCQTIRSLDEMNPETHQHRSDIHNFAYKYTGTSRYDTLPHYGVPKQQNYSATKMQYPQHFVGYATGLRSVFCAVGIFCK